MVAVYTHYVSKSDMGYYDLCLTVLFLIIPFVTLQLRDGAFRFLLESDDSEQRSKIITFVYRTLITSSVVSLVVAIMLVVGGIFMLFCDKLFNKGSDENKLNERRAFNIGLYQCISVIPGVSRSMATIVGGMTQGLTRKRAAEFSFFLAVPTMAGATLLDLLDLLKEDTAWATSHNIMMLILGCVVAFVVALLAMKWFVAFLTKYGFKAFGIYRIIVGGIIIALLLTGHSLAMVD